MTTNKRKLGDVGETLAITHLQDKGYRIVDTNWSCKRGEIDIVANDGETLVFVEVKTRRAQSTADSFVAITARKRKKLIASAQLYLHEHALDDVMWRIDAIGIALPKNHQPIIDHVEDALAW